MIRSGQAVFGGLIAAAVAVVLAFGGFLISTADTGPSGEQLPGPIVILPDPSASTKSSAPDPAPSPAPIPEPIPPPIPIPIPPPVPPPSSSSAGGGGT